jgi:hypothetical protein
MKLPVIRLALSIVLLVSLAGCNNVKDYQSGVDLGSVLSKYETMIRWGQVEQTYGFLEPELAAKTSMQTGLDNVRITGYEVVMRALLLTETTATQTVKISFVLKDRQVERSIIDEQKWVSDDQEKRHWWRANPIPEYR